MSLILEPGTYLNDIPDAGGHLTAIVRCPRCLDYYSVDQAGKPEVCKFRPFMSECLNCDTTHTARPGYQVSNKTGSKLPRSSVLRRPKPSPDTPLFGGPTG